MRAEQGAITRWRLIDQIDQAPGGALVLLVASAGYGKSTVLEQWRSRTARAAALVPAAVGWDAAQLLLSIAEALVPVVPGADRLAEVAKRAEVNWARDLLPALMALARDHAFVLAIDDTHLLASASSRELLAEMARSWPTPSVLLLSGRERPPVPLVRARVAAPILTIGERDLDFDDQEVDAFVAVDSSGVTRRDLVALTGGWPAGVRLAALLRDDDLGGSEITVERYLSAHVLSSYTPHEIDYLGHVAALTPATVAQLDLVLQRNDTEELLRGFERRGLPMLKVPADPTDPVVVHALLGRVLLNGLARRHPEAIEQLVDVAVEAARRANDLTYAFTLLDRHGRPEVLRTFVYVNTFPLISQGRTGELRAWLERFDADQLQEDPLLVFAHANVQRPRDEGRIRSLFDRHASDDVTVLPDGNTPAVASQRMLVAFGLQPADPTDAPQLGGWRQTSGVTRAWDLYADDRLDEAEAVLQSLRDSAAKYPLTDAVGLAKLALVALETGRADRAVALARQAGEVMAAGHMEETALGFVVDTVLLKLARRDGDLDLAERLATDARRKIAKVGDGTMLERVTTLFEIAALYLDLGRPEASIAPLIAEAASITARWPARTVRLDRQLTQLRDQLSRASAPAVAAGGSRATEVITTAELRVLQYLPSHLTLSRIATELYVSHSTVKSQCQSIYRKLQVGNRADAVATASELGLLA